MHCMSKTEVCLLRIKLIIHQEGTATLNLYVLNKRASECTKTETNRTRGRIHTWIQTFNLSLTEMGKGR